MKSLSREGAARASDCACRSMLFFVVKAGVGRIVWKRDLESPASESFLDQLAEILAFAGMETATSGDRILKLASHPYSQVGLSLVPVSTMAACCRRFHLHGRTADLSVQDRSFGQMFCAPI